MHTAEDLQLQMIEDIVLIGEIHHQQEDQLLILPLEEVLQTGEVQYIQELIQILEILTLEEAVHHVLAVLEEILQMEILEILILEEVAHHVPMVLEGVLQMEILEILTLEEAVHHVLTVLEEVVL